jgi:uncharacterized protein YndB with AHSA1/START domain
LVYQAFVDPDQIAQWFGPLQFHVPRDTVSIDPVPGGDWHMTMVNNNNREWTAPVISTLVDVVDNHLLVGYEVARGLPGVPDGTKLTLTIEFIPDGDGTRLELRQGPFPEEMREMSETGWLQSLHKLDGLLATPAKLRATA